MLRVKLFLTQSQWQKLYYSVILHSLAAIPNFCSVAQVLARRGRDWRHRTTLLYEPLNVIIG